MPLPTIPSGNVASSLPSGYNIDNSWKVNRPDSAYMAITPAGNSASRTACTFSFWFKRALLASGGSDIYTIFHTSTTSSGYIYLALNSSQQIDFTIQNASYSSSPPTGFKERKITNRVFRDPASWYHCVIEVDTTEATANDRLKIWINGVLETSFGHTTNNTNQSQALPVMVGSTSHALNVGRQGNGTYFYDGYLAEFCYIDGTAYPPTSFGEFDEDSPTIWKPIDVSELTFGTNGFYLAFEDSANMGNDANGGTDLTEANVTASDQMTDSPTNNFATLNPLYKLANITFSEGNLQHSNAGSWQAGLSTIGVSSGKWYWEVKFTAVTGGSNNAFIGICKTDSGEDNTIILTGNSVNSWGYQNTSGWKNDSTVYATSDYDSWTVNDIVGGYLDLDNLKLYFTKNGTLQNSGTGISVTAGTYVLGCSNYYGTSQVNYGNPPFTISSGNADDNGYGNFEYSPNITGDSVAKKFYALNTKNLAQYG